MEEIGRTPQGVRGLKLLQFIKNNDKLQSHSARSAWIETKHEPRRKSGRRVALRKECVD